MDTSAKVLVLYFLNQSTCDSKCQLTYWKKSYGHIWAPVHKRSADSLYNDDSISYLNENDNDDDGDNDDDHDNTHVLYISIAMID